MDTPKRRVFWLENLSSDIWAYIVWYLPGEQLGRLKMTGATFLWQRLKSSSVVKSINLGEDYIVFKSFPRFLNDFPSLDELLIHSWNLVWGERLGLTIESIPAGVRKLELTGSFGGQPLFGPHSNLSKSIPHLTSIDVSGYDKRDWSWLIHCPSSLTTLRLSEWNGEVALPSSLIHFKARKVSLFSQSFVSELPKLLESFVTSELGGAELVVPLLPPSLGKLFLGRSPGVATGPRSIAPFNLYEQLPKSLTCFEVPSTEDFAINPELASLLPSTLTELEIHANFPSSLWHLLPPNLTTLSFHGPQYEDATDSDIGGAAIADCGDENDDENDEVKGIRVCIPFHDLPKSITRLQLDDSWSGNVYFCDPPTTCNQPCFPPNLTHFKISGVQLSLEMTKRLPPSLTYLNLEYLSERTCEHLPTGLKTLKSSVVLMSPNLINFLPKSLTLLHMWLARSNAAWFDETNGELVACGSLPEYLVHKKCLSNHFEWNQSRLPSTLVHLTFSERNRLGQSFVQHQQLPNLLQFSITHSKGFTDLAIPLLPHHLTTLELNFSSMVSGKSFPFLPRCLLDLNLSNSESIFDSDIQHLPRTLKKLHLDHAMHLTELCIPDLPPQLKNLSVKKNSHITSSSYPNFPSTLRSIQSSYSLAFQTWYTVYGRICQGSPFGT